jgi:hypothetical protein
MALVTTERGVATSIGHSPVAALLILLQEVEPLLRGFIEYCLGSYQGGLNGISLSANWMWA